MTSPRTSRTPNSPRTPRTPRTQRTPNSPQTPRTPRTPRTPENQLISGNNREPPPAPSRAPRRPRARRQLFVDPPDFDLDVPEFDLDYDVPEHELDIPAYVEDKTIANKQIKFGNECPICYNDLVPSDQSNPVCEIVACGHNFHCGCLQSWRITGKNNCPVCRATIDNVVQKSSSASFSSFGRKKPKESGLTLKQINSYLKYICSFK